MKIAAIDIRPYAVALRAPLRTARGVIDRRTGAIVVARADDGITGLGEIAPLPPFSRETTGEATDAARAIAPRLLGLEIGSPDSPADPMGMRAQLERVAEGLDLPPSAAFGLETALADLASRAAGLPLARWLHAGAAARVPVNALLAPDAAGEAGERAGGNGGAGNNERRREGQKETVRGEWAPTSEEEALEALLRRGYLTVKIKVGGIPPRVPRPRTDGAAGRLGSPPRPAGEASNPIEEDAARVERVRRALGAGVAIRLDANRAWPYDHAVAALRRLAPLGIAYVEEPLVAADLDRLPELREATGVPIALDETVYSPGPFARLLATGAVEAVILKPSLAGGLLPSLELARCAAAAGAGAVITTLLETAVGTAACLHLAAALGPEVPACGLDTLRRLFGAAIPGALEVRDGAIDLPIGPGLGISIEAGGTGR